MSAARDLRLNDPEGERSAADVSDDRRPRRWTVGEFHQLYDAGILAPEARAELVAGEIFEMSPMNPQHATGMRKVRRALLAAFGAGFVVSDQLPLTLDAATELYPDFSVGAGDEDDFADRHPTGALLVVAVSDSTYALIAVRRRRSMPRRELASTGSSICRAVAWR